MGRARLVSALLVGGIAAVATPAAAAPEWQDGVATNVVGVIPTPGGFVPGPVTLQSAGFLAEPDGSGPRVGEVIYLRGRVGVIPPGLADAPIMRFVFDPALAPDVTFAISAATPVRCSTYTDPAAPAAVNCAQAPQDTGGGAYFFGGLPSQAGGRTFEVQVPVRVSAPKNGQAGGNAARFGVQVTSTFGVADATAFQHLVVPPASSGGSAGDAPATAARLRVRPRAGSARRGRPPVRLLRFVLSERARVVVALQRRPRAGAAPRTVRTLPARSLAAGPRILALGRLRAGGYRAVVRLRDGAGNRSTAAIAFRVSSPLS